MWAQTQVQEGMECVLGATGLQPDSDMQCLQVPHLLDKGVWSSLYKTEGTFPIPVGLWNL
jgi:hypothetical protein